MVNGEDLVGEGGKLESVKAMATAQIKHGDGFFGDGGNGNSGGRRWMLFAGVNKEGFAVGGKCQGEV